MSLYLVDLMPVLWSVLLVVSVAIASRGNELWLIYATVPGLIGFAFYAAGYPARTEVFAAVCTAALIGTVRLSRRLVSCVRRFFSLDKETET